MRRIFIIPILCVSLLVASGCSALKANDLLAYSAQDKESLLRERLEKYSRAMYWGATSEIVPFVGADFRNEFLNEEVLRRQNERLVKTEISSVLLNESDNTADVKVTTSYYRKPRYIVQTRIEDQLWNFDRFKGGWLLSARKITEVDEDGVSRQQAGAKPAGDPASRARPKTSASQY